MAEKHVPAAPGSPFESQRQFIQQRAQELLARVDQMDDEELRWTVRVFADCLPAEKRTENLGAYSEYWPVEELRRFVSTFIQHYTTLALEELNDKQGKQESCLAGLTEEELQSMSVAEKWQLLAKDPRGLGPDQLRRELARLFMCKSFNLFHDSGLSEAAVEFPAYHRVREALEKQPNSIVEDLTRMILLRARRLGVETPEEVEAALGEIREAISRALTILVPADRLFAGQMVRLPLDPADEIPQSDAQGVGDILDGTSTEDTATTLLVFADLMSVREWDEYLLPFRRQYRSLAHIPPADLRVLLARLAGKMGDRRITDFAERYRSGRMMAERKMDPSVWEILSPADRLAILERDNRTMDLVQSVRHLAKIFFSFRYETLFDAGFHTDLLRSPRYQDLVNRLIDQFAAGPQRETKGRPLEELTQTVTRMMLQIENKPPEARPAGLQEVRAVIAAALGLPDDLTYPAGREGRA